jgi:glucose-6-phosphate 1-dehydrogenase
MANQEPAVLEPAILVIFGITGDLSKRKLLPALYHLFKDNLLGEHTVILGVTRRDIEVNDLLSDVELCINETDGLCDPRAVAKLNAHLQMMKMDITKGSEYRRLLEKLNEIEDKEGLCMNRLYYLSIPPQVTGSIVTQLGENRLNKSCKHSVAESRLLIEKPFGYDLLSAEELITTISKQFSERQIFRIDHYLAKETVQNIVTFRFNNIFEKVWDREHISHILITAAETIDIEGRAIFYEQVGALRDIIQSHLLQLLAVTTLDIPERLSSTRLHEAKLKLLDSVEPVSVDHINEHSVRGQYEGYEKDVNNPNSATETFAALRLHIDSDRWRDVPILIRTGKSLAKKITEIKIVFKADHRDGSTNILTFRIQPHEGIELDLQVKKPGFEEELQTTPMEFTYRQAFDDDGHPDAYERVLVDAVRGDHTLFSTSLEVMAAWRIVEPVIIHWSKGRDNLYIYPTGSWGPKEADILAEKTGINWLGEPS